MATHPAFRLQIGQCHSPQPVKDLPCLSLEELYDYHNEKSDGMGTGMGMEMEMEMEMEMVLVRMLIGYDNGDGRPANMNMMLYGIVGVMIAQRDKSSNIFCHGGPATYIHTFTCMHIHTAYTQKTYVPIYYMHTHLHSHTHTFTHTCLDGCLVLRYCKMRLISQC